MADVIALPDGRNETILDERDFMRLLEEYMGFEARRWLEEWLGEKVDDADYIDDLEKEAGGLRAHHREVMTELRTYSETLAGLIREKEIDRKALSAVAGNIGCIVMREANR